jgi:hypothetical protein
MLELLEFHEKRKNDALFAQPVFLPDLALAHERMNFLEKTSVWPNRPGEKGSNSKSVPPLTMLSATARPMPPHTAIPVPTQPAPKIRLFPQH